MQHYQVSPKDENDGNEPDTAREVQAEQMKL